MKNLVHGLNEICIEHTGVGINPSDKSMNGCNSAAFVRLVSETATGGIEVPGLETAMRNTHRRQQAADRHECRPWQPKRQPVHRTQIILPAMETRELVAALGELEALCSELLRDSSGITKKEEEGAFI